MTLNVGVSYVLYVVRLQNGFEQKDNSVCYSCAPIQVCVEVLVEYPFFVFGQGWSSCCPDRTTQLFELSCAKLCVGDVCVSLTLRSLKNGSVTDSRAMGTKRKTGNLSNSSHSVDLSMRNSMSPNAAGSNSGLLMKGSSADRMERQQATGTGPGFGLPAGMGPVEGQADRIYRAGPMVAVPGTGDVRHESVTTDVSTLCKLQCIDQQRPSARKRRWSAPERDQTERAEEEPPLTLLKSSFIPQEVKISIEGHSSAGREIMLEQKSGLLRKP